MSTFAPPKPWQLVYPAKKAALPKRAVNPGAKRRPLGDGRGGIPTNTPLYGPPGPPPKTGPASLRAWPSVPTRQNYENGREREWQGRYMQRYGTLFPEAGIHF